MERGGQGEAERGGRTAGMRVKAWMCMIMGRRREYRGRASYTGNESCRETYAGPFWVGGKWYSKVGKCGGLVP